MRTKTELCVECHENRPDKGRICERCRYQKRKAYYQEWNKATRTRYRTSRRDWKTNNTERLRALAAHGVRCQECGWDLEPGILQCHHRDHDRSNHKIENLAILCPTCHIWHHYKTKTGLFHSHASKSTGY